MEEMENGYDDTPSYVPLAGSSKRPHQSIVSDGSDGEVEERRIKQRRREEKLRKRELKAAKRAERAAQNMADENVHDDNAPEHSAIGQPHVQKDGESGPMDGHPETASNHVENGTTSENPTVKEKKKKRDKNKENALTGVVDQSAQNVESNSPHAGPSSIPKTLPRPSQIEHMPGTKSSNTESRATPSWKVSNADSQSNTALMDTNRSLPDSSNPFQKPPRKRKATSSGSKPAGSSSQAVERETDEELKRRFKTPGAMEDWLASQWWSYAYLTRLEAAGILKYKKGKFSETEKSAIRAYLESFKEINRVDSDELLALIMAKGRSGDRKDYPKFWPEVAQQVPGRPVKAVKDFVKRDYDPRGNKGAWTKEEDDELLRAFTTHPNEWSKIAVCVDRTENDCRDRYKNELQHLQTRQTGHWDPAEEKKLVKCIREANTSIGNEPMGYEAPWDVVCEMMEGKRTRTQCRKKWQDQLRATELRKGERTKFSKSDRMLLIAKLRRLDVASETEIDWHSFCTGPWSGFSASTFRHAFWRMKKAIEGQETMDFEELLEAIAQTSPSISTSPARPQSMTPNPGYESSNFNTPKKNRLLEGRNPISKDIIESEDEAENDEVEAEILEDDGKEE